MKFETKQRRETRMIELVETNNLAVSLRRLINAPGFDSRKWHRALYHALGLAISDRNILEKIRQALDLP